MALSRFSHDMAHFFFAVAQSSYWIWKRQEKIYVEIMRTWWDSRDKEKNVFWNNTDLVKYCQDKEKIYVEIMRTVKYCQDEEKIYFEIMRTWWNNVKTKRKYILRLCGLGEILSRQRENIFWDNADLVKYCQDKKKIYVEIMRTWWNTVKTKRKCMLR